MYSATDILYYIHNGTEKQVVAYFVQFYFYTNVMHVAHVPEVVTFASQAYTQRIFSVCGDLTAGKRNRTEAALQRRVFLKANNLKFLY